MVQSNAPSGFFASEEIFKHLINSVEDYAIFVIDVDGNIITWNKGAQKIKGYSADEAIGQHISIFYTADDIKKGEPMQNLRFATVHGHYEKEGWRVRKDGSKFWANIVFTALYDDHGNLRGFAKVTRDMTEIKKTREELEFLNRQIDLSNDAIYTFDDNIKIKNWNLGAQNLYGFTKEEALGKDPNELLKTILSEEEIGLALKEVTDKNYWSGEIKRKTKTGREIYVHASTTTIRDNNRIISGYVSISFDITKEKELREQVNHLATIIEHATEAIISRGMDKRIISWNKGAEKLFGYSKAEVRGKTFTELAYVRLTANEIAEIEDQIIRTGIWKAEMNYFRKDGSSFFGSVTGNAIRNQQGETTSIIFIIWDITKRKELEDELKKLNEELEQKVEQRTTEIYKNEKRYRALIENSVEGISLLDEFSNVFYRSPSGIKMLGNNPTTDSLRLAHPEDLVAFKNKFAEALEKPGIAVPYTARYLRASGDYFWAEGTFTNLLQVSGVQAVVANYRDITERVRASEEIMQTTQQLRDLSAHLQSIREEERAYVAREIHDELGQQLTGLKMDMSALTSRLSSNDDVVIEKIQSIQQLLNHSIKTVRRIATELRPSILDDLGLVAAIEWQCEEFEKRSGIKTRFVSDLEQMIFNSAISICLFRICQESLTNVARYACAKNVQISLHRIDEMIVFKICDDGIGFDTSRKGNKKTWGLIGMKERAAMVAGSLAIHSKPENGTTLEITVPFSSNK
jgi:PAS domain S-box-containing protein